MSMAEGMADRLEATRPGDRYADYCLWDYLPPQPTAGKLRSASLLWNSFEVAGLGPNGYRIADTIRRGVGPFRTVWGVKQVEGALSWEFYFYDYARLQRQVSIPRVVDMLRPLVDCSLSYPETRPYFMFSIDLDADLAEGRRSLDLINIYVGNPGSSVSSGIGYALTPEGLRLDNFYFFFDARQQFDEIVGKIACSAHLDLPRPDLDDLLWPPLLDCQTIVVANKKFNDSLYFSRVGIDGLIYFLDRMAYPARVQEFVQRHRNRLDHMLYDVGIDYVTRNGRIEIIKSGYYGLI